MKKFFLFFTLLCSSINISLALNPADLLNKVPDNFTPECYEYYTKIDRAEVWNNESGEKYNVYKIKLDKTEDLVISQYGFILPYKYYSGTKQSYTYTTQDQININYLTDYNYNTFIDLDTKTQDEIILSFKEKIEKNSFSFIFNYIANNLKAKYYISDDNINWDLIKEENLKDFSFNYLKIKFVNKNLIDSRVYREIIKIYELNFPKKSDIIIVKSFYNNDIEIYSSYNCKDKNFNTSFKSYDNFSIDKNTKLIEIVLDKNPKYNVYTKKDSDNDWVEDSIDNCKNRYNPDQSDTNGDGIGDICGDDDNDGITGYYDNCINMYNPDQKDVNRNGVGDICEFDKDNDGIFDSIDNCINNSNPDQRDSDNDNIGDSCDNCSHYNPSQIDVNQNGVGDICEDIEKNLQENDDDKDGIINGKDNCREVKNEDQLDLDQDGIGDVCDNCPNIQNKDQLDNDKNGIGDMCEDNDNDGILGYLDNCINIKNENQEDSDNDGVGNLCEDDDRDNIIFANDNCPNKYNPEQIDIDKDGVGDACDSKDDRYIESNSNFFIALLILISAVFLIGIYMTVKNLNNK